uniref:Uncharacterized protein n=1 Tax=Salix viminalis TaxID=40686 RepID=A0A6N2N2N3_SALVM
MEEGKVNRDKAKEMRPLFADKDQQDKYVEKLLDHLKSHGPLLGKSGVVFDLVKLTDRYFNVQTNGMVDVFSKPLDEEIVCRQLLVEKLRGLLILDTDTSCVRGQCLEI